MLERMKKRQEVLESHSHPTTEKLESVKTIEPLLPSPSQHQRCTRLTELANRVDQWLEEDNDLKSNVNVTSEIEVIILIISL